MSTTRRQPTTVTQPYLQHHCEGLYMQPGMPWTDSGGDCSQTCDKRHACYAAARAAKEAARER